MGDSSEKFLNRKFIVRSTLCATAALTFSCACLTTIAGRTNGSAVAQAAEITQVTESVDAVSAKRVVTNVVDEAGTVAEDANAISGDAVSGVDNAATVDESALLAEVAESARARLSAKVDSVRAYADKYEHVPGVYAVSDSAYADANSAAALVDCGTNSLTDISDALSALEADMDDMVAVVEKFESKLSYYRDIAEYQISSSYIRSGDCGDDVWSPTYYVDHLTDEADSNGALTEWYYNYYIAHNWSANGMTISAMPAFVYLNGTLWVFDSATTLPRDCQAMDAINWFNGCLGFQTCLKGQDYYLFVRYVPAP